MANKKLLTFSLICGLVSVMLLSLVGFSDSCKEMNDNIIRIRILANSNSTQDQTIKLLVRDAVLEHSKDVFKDVSDYDEAVSRAECDLKGLLEVAQNTLSANGCDLPVSLSFRDEYFDTRSYDDFTLPAGVYKTAVFTIGEGKGENWWCVIFPRVCIGASSDNLNRTISDEANEKAYNPQKYVFKFKTIEIFEKIKNIFNF